MPNTTTLGEFIRQKRGEQGLTQGQLASRVGVAVETVNRIENGVTCKPRATTVVAIAKALGVHPLELDQREAS